MPEFHLFSVKRVSNATKKELVFSLSRTDFAKNSPEYLGKLKSNFTGTKFKLLSRGVKVLKPNSDAEPRKRLANVDLVP